MAQSSFNFAPSGGGFGLGNTTNSGSLFSGFGTSQPTANTSQGFSFGGLGAGTNLAQAGSTTTGTTTLKTPFNWTATTGTPATTQSSFPNFGGINTQVPSTSMAPGTNAGQVNIMNITKATRFSDLPPESQKFLANLDNHIQQQKRLMSYIGSMSLPSVKQQIQDVFNESRILFQKLAQLTNDLQSDHRLVNDLLSEIDVQIGLVDNARRFYDAASQGLSNAIMQIGDNVFSKFYYDLIVSFENRLQQYDSYIEELERHFTWLHQNADGRGNEQDLVALTEAMRNQHGSFMAITGKVALLHESVEKLRQKYLTYRRNALQDNINPFDRQDSRLKDAVPALSLNETMSPRELAQTISRIPTTSQTQQTNKTSIERSLEGLNFNNQHCSPMFIAIIKALLTNENHYMSAEEIVGELNHLLHRIRNWNFKQLNSNTPTSTIQGAISTTNRDARINEFTEPIEKYMIKKHAYYRINLELFPSDVRALMNTPFPVSSSAAFHPVANKKQLSIKRVKPTFSKFTLRSASKRNTSDSINHHVTSKKVKLSHQRFVTTRSSHYNKIDVDNDKRERIIKEKRERIIKEKRERIIKEKSVKRKPKASSSVTDEDSYLNLNGIDIITRIPLDFNDIDTFIGPSSFAVAQQTGYSGFRNKPSQPKAECQDAYCVKDLRNHDGSHIARLFCLADGHGGSGCSQFLIENIPDRVEKLLQELLQDDHTINFDDENTQNLFKKWIKDLIKKLDDEYIDDKREKFRRWKHLRDQGNDSAKPDDDGATLIINLFVGNWFVNVNVDHKPFLERLALQIFQSGGMFVESKNGKTDKNIEFDPFINRPIRKNMKKARIRLSDQDEDENEDGIPFKDGSGKYISLNVAATCGDLFFKLDPLNRIIDCVPDVFFKKLDGKYNGDRFLLMCSDGLIDHLRESESKADRQNQIIANFIGEKLFSENPVSIVKYLCDREGDRKFFNDLQDYDDCTCILISL
ncbi:26339_t:CDS:10 [Gigaspora margarita]|uniref:26339_t:CDS:1 n=1 Tax=Gigaspora margarita TaxID=4874 RepID=A0ABN7USX1_GIGMA|nr:26339_t:CDS:10 [Gigaspora margarita]